MIDKLRQLAEQRKWSEVKIQAETAYGIRRDPSCLPLICLANIHLGLQQAAQDAAQLAEGVAEQLDIAARVDMAAVYLLAHQFGKASALLEAAVQELPAYSLALARLAQCRQMQGDALSALALYRSALAAAPRRVQAWIPYLRLLMSELGKAKAAEKTDKLGNLINGLREANEQLAVQRMDLPADVAAQWQTQLSAIQLQLWVQLGEFARAESWVDEQATQLPVDAWCELVASLAALQASHGQHDAAEECLRKALQAHPGNAVLTLQLVDLARLQGRDQQAVALLLRAIDNDKEKVPLWARLSAAFLHRDAERARKAAEKAIELAKAQQPGADLTAHQVFQQNLQAKLALAHVESDEQNFDQAEKLYREILNEHSQFVPALQGLGHQELQRGRIDEAVVLFEKIRAIDPVAGYTALINARKMPDDPKVLEKLEQAAHMPSMEGEVRTGILFQLAAAHEKRKEYDRAFVLAREANEASKKLLEYNPKAHRSRCARIRARFSKALFEHRKGYGSDAALPVFVLGMPRSGTTLVEQIIAGHSQVFGAGELSVIPQVIAGLQRWERHTGSGRSYPDCVDDLSAEVVNGIADHVLKEFRSFDADAAYVVDKLPHNFENIGLIKFLFPKAKIISVRRDPRDIAMSNYFTDYQAKHGGMGFAYDLTWIGEQLADHNLLMHHWNQLFPGEILEISYEDVVEDPEGMARKMLDYLALPWEPQVMNTAELDRPVKTASVWQVRQPIYKTSKAKWMNYQRWLTPLIEGTNAKISPAPVNDMVSLPVPGYLHVGVAAFREGKLDDAELSCKKLLHHLPEHAAGNFMLGLVYVQKGYLEEGITLMEKANRLCPWKREWRQDLIKAYELAGQPEKSALLRKEPGEPEGRATSDLHSEDPHFSSAA